MGALIPSECVYPENFDVGLCWQFKTKLTEAEL